MGGSNRALILTTDLAPSVYSSTVPVGDTTTAATGSASTLARSDHSHGRERWTPADHGFLTWTFDPAVVYAAGTALPTAGLMYTTRLHLPVAASVTNIVIYLTGAGVGLTAGQCFAALYRSGTLIGVSGDQSGTWNSGGTKTMALAGGPYALAAGDVIVGLWFVGTTGPSVFRGNNTAAANIGLTATSSRFGTADAGLTTTAPNPLGALSAYNVGHWAALS